jgi:hypothetical protein
MRQRTFLCQDTLKISLEGFLESFARKKRLSVTRDILGQTGQQISSLIMEFDLHDETCRRIVKTPRPHQNAAWMNSTATNFRDEFPHHPIGSAPSQPTDIACQAGAVRKGPEL